MAPFDSSVARDAVRNELPGRVPDGELECLLESMRETIAAASIGQVYKATLP